MSPRSLISGPVVLASALLLAACGGSATSPSASGSSPAAATASGLSASVASSASVSVDSITFMKDDGAGKAGAAATTFDPTEHIHALAKLNKIDKGLKAKVSWVAVNVPFFGDEEIIFEKELSALVANEINTDADLSESEPLGGEWQPGTYRLDVYLDSTLAKSAEFTVLDTRPLNVRSMQLFRDDGAGKRSSKPSTTFAPSDRKIYTVVLTTGAKVDSAVHPNFQWVALGSGAAQKNQVIKEIEAGTLYANRLNGNLSLQQDWPVGKYQLNVLFDSKMAKSAPFEVK